MSKIHFLAIFLLCLTACLETTAPISQSALRLRTRLVDGANPEKGPWVLEAFLGTADRASNQIDEQVDVNVSSQSTWSLMVDAGALSKVNNQTWYSRDFSQSYTASIRGVYPGNIVLSTVTDLNLTKIPNTDMPNWKLRAAANCSPIERGFSSNMVTEGLRCGFQEALYHQVVNPQATGFYRYSGEYLCGFHYELVDGLGTLALTDTTGSVVVNSPTMTTCGSTDTVVYTAPNKIIDNSEVLIRISSVSMPSFSRTVSINLRKPTAPVIAVNIFRDVYSYYSINYPTLVIYTLNIPIPLPQYPLDMYWIEVDGLPNILGYGSNHPLIKELIIMKGTYLADLSIPPVYISYWRKRFGENKIELDLSFPIVDCPEIISFCQNLDPKSIRLAFFAFTRSFDNYSFKLNADLVMSFKIISGEGKISNFFGDRDPPKVLIHSSTEPLPGLQYQPPAVVPQPMQVMIKATWLYDPDIFYVFTIDVPATP